MIFIDSIFSKSLLAGVSVSLGGYLYLLSSGGILGSILLSVGILSCSVLSLNLFTSKIGFLTDNSDLRRSLLVLILNLFAAITFGLIVRFVDQSVSLAADNIVNIRLASSIPFVILSATVTGFLMTVTVSSVKEDSKSYIPFILCCVAFSLFGGSHAIIDSFYYSVSNATLNDIGSALLRLFIAVLFNFIGCNLYNLFVNRSFIHGQ